MRRIICSSRSTVEASVMTSAVPAIGATPARTLPERLLGANSTLGSLRTRLIFQLSAGVHDEQVRSVATDPHRRRHRLAVAFEGGQRNESLIGQCGQRFAGHTSQSRTSEFRLCVVCLAPAARTERSGSDGSRSNRSRTYGARSNRSGSGRSDVATRIDIHVHVVVVLALIGFPVEVHSGAATVVGPARCRKGDSRQRDRRQHEGSRGAMP